MSFAGDRARGPLRRRLTEHAGPCSPSPGRRLPIRAVLKNHHNLCPRGPVLQVFSLAVKNGILI